MRSSGVTSWTAPQTSHASASTGAVVSRGIGCIASLADETGCRSRLRSGSAIAAGGSPGRQGCRCDDHERLTQLLRDKTLQPLSDALSHHFEHIVASLCFERSGVTLPDFARLFAGYKEP